MIIDSVKRFLEASIATFEEQLNNNKVNSIRDYVEGRVEQAKTTLSWISKLEGELSL